MTEKTKKTGSRLARQLLWMIAKSGLISLILFLILFYIAVTVAENYCFYNDIPMTEFDWMDLERWIFGASILLSIGVFSALFLLLLADRMRYIRRLTAGIEALRQGQQDHVIALEGNNELTQLADAINEMSAAQQRLRQQEQALAMEKERFVRTMSHDIRTPLTSILSYSEYLAAQEGLTEEQKGTMALIRRKAEQIRDLTDILLDGGKRNLEQFQDAKLLMQQLAAEFEEGLEEQFAVTIDLSHCPAFAANFDVQELRRIFDNLSSNIQKYADSALPVQLSIRAGEGQLEILQRNALWQEAPTAESYGLGLHSIRRIAQNYGGGVEVQQTETEFEISIIFRNL